MSCRQNARTGNKKGESSGEDGDSILRRMEYLLEDKDICGMCNKSHVGENVDAIMFKLQKIHVWEVQWTGER